MSRNDRIKNNDNFHEENNTTNIKFMRKKLKNRIILFFKILGLLVISTTVSVIIIYLIFNYKYKDITCENNKSINNSIEDYSDVIDSIKNSLVTIGSDKNSLLNNTYIDGNGTGIIIRQNGSILTNYSVIKDLKEVYVNLPFINSEPLKADIIFTNEEIDIAVLQVDCENTLTPIKVASRDDINEGEKVLLISNSTSDDYIDSLVPGVITSTNRHLEVNNNKYSIFEVNTPINKFNTGGVISNLKGEVIGIASKKITDIMNAEGFYYSLDLSSLEKVIDNTNEIKSILGILEGELIKVDFGGIYGGLYVARVNKDNGSNKDGLRPTDIIFEIDGEKLNNIEALLDRVKNKKNGDTVICKVMRSGSVIEIEIELSNIYK